MSTHSHRPASSLRHRVFVSLACVAVLLVVLLSPLPSGMMFHPSRTLGNSPAHLFAAASVRHAGSVHLRRTAGGHGLHIARAARTGYWHTEGNRIVNEHGAMVRINGLNWSGFETTQAVPGGLQVQDYHAILREVAAAGYNTVRLPFSNQMVEQPTIPTAIAFDGEQGPINTDLEGLDSMQILDHIVAAAGDAGLKVILDDHRSEAGSTAEQNGLWYTAQYPEQAWIQDWATLAQHFRGNPTVIGFDLRNEPHSVAGAGACWSCGGARDWHQAAGRAGNAVLAENGKLLIFVEGVDQYEDTNSFWGGNLAGVRVAPVRLNLPGHLVYSPHVYGPSEYQQPWFNSETTPASLIAKYRRNWAYISESGLAPVWIGEFGAPKDAASVSSMEPGSEGQWFHTLVSYLAQHNEIGWSYWSLNGEDRYGLMDSAYHVDPASELSAALAPIRMHAPVPVEESPPALELAATPGHSSFAKFPQFHLAKFSFHLLRHTAHTSDEGQITVAYDAPHAATAPALHNRPVLTTAAPATQSFEAMPTHLPTAAAVESTRRARGAAVVEDPAVAGAVAEQVRRQTESALSNIAPDAE